MGQPEPFQIFTGKFNELGIPYMVSGSVAAIFYGEPRMTNDVDIVVDITANQIPALEQAFPDLQFYRPPAPVIEIEIKRSQRAHFNLIHHETGLKADIYPRCDKLHAWGMANTRTFELNGSDVVVAPPEYVIIRKLQFFQEGGSTKHLRDIQRMKVFSGDIWQLPVIGEFVTAYGLAEEWSLAMNGNQD
jgi:hypothetical protein